MKLGAWGIIVALLAVLTVGCSSGDISGTYISAGNKTLKLTKEKKLLLGAGAADYSVEGSKIFVTTPIFGGTEGRIEGNNLVFPGGEGSVAHDLQGTWTKQ